jgi:hypothetical protein
VIFCETAAVFVGGWRGLEQAPPSGRRRSIRQMRDRIGAPSE